MPNVILVTINKDKNIFYSLKDDISHILAYF